MTGYGIAAITMYPGSYFIFGDWGTPEKRFKIINGKIIRCGSGRLRKKETEFIKNWMEKYSIKK